MTAFSLILLDFSAQEWGGCVNTVLGRRANTADSNRHTMRCVSRHWMGDVPLEAKKVGVQGA